MVKHIILWTLHPDLSEKEKHRIKLQIKVSLEDLVGRVPGLISLEVRTEPLASSNCDVMLDATLADEAALHAYAVHPDHVAAAGNYVKPFTAQRVCMDFVE